jgi:hypothetical protein
MVCPPHQVAEQLSIYQQNLREKTRQMKAMASELNMYQAQVNEYKFEIERLTRELQVQPLNINHHPRHYPRVSLIRLFAGSPGFPDPSLSFLPCLWDHGRTLRRLNLNLETRNQKPETRTRNPEPETRKPETGTRNPKPETRRPETRNQKPESRNPCAGRETALLRAKAARAALENRN